MLILLIVPCLEISLHRKSVRKALAQLIATVARHELPEGQWPELLQFVEEFTRSQDAQQREVSKRRNTAIGSHNT